jgi:hypothetical protein
MKRKRPTGRPSSSRNVRITPKPLKEPDMQKLGHALIDIAQKILAIKKAETQVDGQDDGVP